MKTGSRRKRRGQEMEGHLEERHAVAPMGVESAVVKFEVVMNAEFRPIREEELAVVERSGDGGMDARERILEDPHAITKAAEAEGAEKQDGDDPDGGGEGGGSRTGLRLGVGGSAQRRNASFSAFTRMKRLESNEAPSSRTSVKTCARTAAVSATSRRQAKPGRARASFEKSTR